MKIIEQEKADRHGEYPVCRVKGSDATPQKIFDWLQIHADGYKFAIVFDTTKGEYEVPDESEKGNVFIANGWCNTRKDFYKQKRRRHTD